MIAAIEENAAGWLPVFARLPGARRDGRSVVSDLDHPLCNAIVFPDAAEVDVERELAAPHPRLWWIGSRAAAIVPALEERALEAEEDPGMALALDRLPEVREPEGVRIEQVTGARVHDFAEPLSTAFDFPPHIVPPLLDALGAAPEEDFANFVAYEGERPIGTATVLFHAGVAGLYNVATLPSRTRRGVGTALTVRAFSEARERGVATGILHASPSGYPIYLRLGFERLTTVRTFVTR